MSAPVSAFAGLRVVVLSQRLAALHVANVFADFGAEVVLVEPPGGCRLRESALFPFLARGTRSLVLDLADEEQRADTLRIASAADVVVDSFLPGVAERLGLDHGSIAAGNAGVVTAGITGFPATGPYSHVPGHEGLVMAKIGGSHVFGPMTERPGPSYAAMPFGEFSAAQTCLHGVLAALVERASSGRGQRVSTSLVQGIAASDIWNWFLHLLTTRYADAFSPAPHVEHGVPNSALIYRLIVALSKDGEWLQFSQTSRHLYVALMEVLGFGWMFEDPAWEGIPLVEDPDQRVELWSRMLTAVRDRTFDQWREVFDAHPNVWAEPFRRGSALLDHPQLQHDGGAVTIPDPDLGDVRQPAGLCRATGTPPQLDRPAPRLDADRADVLRWTPPAVAPAGAAPLHPLDGVTVLELGLYYAAPFAGNLLADLGARVIKIEPIEGDPLRALASFPEIGAIKVLQGKELVALDLASDEGRAVVHELAGRADIVIQSFRAGVAERLGVDAQTLHAINPDLVYVNAPGYGVDGPCGHRPAYAPTIAAASGIAWRLAGATMPTDPLALDVEATKAPAVRLVSASNAAFAQSDGLSALAVATVCLLGLVARQRGAGGQQILTSMLSTAAHANAEDVVSYAGRPATPTPDPELFGLGPRYRLYPTASGWVFLAVPGQDEWARLLEDPEFADLSGPDAAALQAIFARRPATEWEDRLTAAGIGCVAVTESGVEAVLMSDGFGRASGLVADVEHPMLGAHPRLAALQKFSRSQSLLGGADVVGAHTGAVLAELGYDERLIAELRDRKVIALA